MSNGTDSENLDDLQNSQSLEPVVSVKVDIDNVASKQDHRDEGDHSEQSSAANTPLERSQEISQDSGLPNMLNPNVPVKEWSTLINLMARIPVKAQKGLSTLDLKLTCIATIGGSEEILVIGTNVGIVYWYNRRTDVLDRLRCEGVNAVTALSCISTVDYMVAAGNQVGIVTIFQIPRDLPTDKDVTSTSNEIYERKTRKSQRFLVQDLHKGAITALEWSRNGMKLFSGDQSGHVVLTDIDYDLVQIRSSVLICENYEVVQLSYARKTLLICSTFRSIIYSLESKTLNQVGSLGRKIMGKFGGLIISSAWEESPKIYSVRPGARLWVADLSGVVQHTIKLKELILSGSQPEINVIKPIRMPRQLSQQDIQFSRVFRFMKDYLVTYYKDILHVIDARNTLVLGTCKELRSILDVAVNKDEIFILESARNVIRISAKPDNFASLTPNYFLDVSSNYNASINSNSNSTSSTSNTFQHPYDEISAGIKNIPDIMSASISDFRFPQEPINFLTSKLRETSSKVINSTLINTIKTAIEADVEIEDGQKLTMENLPSPAHIAIPHENGDIASDYLSTYLAEMAEPVFVPEPERFQKITNLPFEDVVVDSKPQRNRKCASKKRDIQNVKKCEPSELTSDSVSVCSGYSNTSGSDNNISTGKGGVSSSTSTSSSARKFSFKSDVTLSSSNSGSEGASSSDITRDQLGIPLSLSHSWTIGTLLPNKSVTTEELHLKEELLARRLKWPELLPDSVLPDELFDETNENGRKDKPHQRNCSQLNLSHRNSDREDRSSISTLIGLKASSDADDDTDSKTLSLDQSSSLGTMIEQTTVDADNRLDTSDSSESEDDRYYIDIYTRYRKKDSVNTDSLNSALSFGPPSGSSYVSGVVSSLNAISNSNHVNGNVLDNELVSSTNGSTTDQTNLLQPSISLASSEDELNNSKETSTGTSSSSSMVEEIDSIVESKIVTDEHWRRWRLPGPIIQIVTCDNYIMCVGCKGVVYHTQFDPVGLRWKSTSYCASGMAVSPCGSVVWRIHNRDLYSLTNPSCIGPINENGESWSRLTQKKDVAYAVVQKSFGWVVKSDGSLEFCTGLLETRLVPYFEKVYTPWPIQEVACCGHKIWALTSDGRIVLRTGTSNLNPKGVDWIELRWSVSDFPPACSISSGEIREDGVTSVWFADANANLYFTYDEKDNKGTWIPWKVSVSNCLIYPQVQPRSVLFNSIREQVSKSFKSLKQAKSMLTLSSSKNSIWFAASESSQIYGNRYSVTGHYWKPLRVDRGTMIPSNWTNVYADSIYKGHGSLWITDSKGYLFHLPPSGGKLQQVDPPMFTEGQIINVAPAPEAIWALASTGDIFGRCNINSSDCIGKGWRQISLSTLKSSTFVHISCGSEVAWAVDDSGGVYLRIGNLNPPGVQDMSPAWNKVESSLCCKGVFAKVYVGANDSMVWALDNSKRVYVRQAVYPDYPIGTGWLMVKGIDAVMLSISDSAVWALSTNGDIYRRHGITKTNFVGDYWRKVPGTATAITVSLCDELWALNSDGYLSKHSKKIMPLGGVWNDNANSSQSLSRIVLDEEDEDWELVDNPEI